LAIDKDKQKSTGDLTPFTFLIPFSPIFLPSYKKFKKNPKNVTICISALDIRQSEKQQKRILLGALITASL